MAAHSSIEATFGRFCTDVGRDPGEPYSADAARAFCMWWAFINKGGATMSSSFPNYHYRMAHLSRWEHSDETLSRMDSDRTIKLSKMAAFSDKRGIRQSAPLTAELMEKIARIIDRRDVHQLQLYTMMALGWVGFLRPSEIVGQYAPRFRNLLVQRHSVSLILDDWKWRGARQPAVITYQLFSGARARDLWWANVASLLFDYCIAVFGRPPLQCVAEFPHALVFPRLSRSGAPLDRRISVGQFSARLRGAVASAGIANPGAFAPGSLRRGAVTSGVATGMSRAVMRRHLRWRPQTDLFNLYDEPDGATVRREQLRQAGQRTLWV